MVLTPFEHPPKKLFLLRMLIPSVGVFALGFLVLGLVARAPGIYGGKDRRPSSFSPPVPIVSSYAPWATAGTQMLQTTRYWLSMPGVCVTGREVNDFQKSQCALFWHELQLSTLISLVPFVFVGLFMLIALDQMSAFYRKAKKTIQKGKALGKGVVTDPAEVRSDLFAWFYCLRTIGVQLPSGKQMRVYIPFEIPVPRPGEKLAIFEAGELMGQRRHTGLLYAPHVAVISGS